MEVLEKIKQEIFEIEFNDGIREEAKFCYIYQILDKYAKEPDYKALYEKQLSLNETMQETNDILLKTREEERQRATKYQSAWEEFKSMSTHYRTRESAVKELELKHGIKEEE